MADAGGATEADRRYAVRRSNARLAATQALYQLEYGGRGVDAVVREFLAERLPEDDRLDDLDAAFFECLIRGVVARQDEVDAAITDVLAEGWSLRRLDATVRAILRVGAYEILAAPEVPTGAILDAALVVADAFFDGSEPKFINGALSALARERRAGTAV